MTDQRSGRVRPATGPRYGRTARLQRASDTEDALYERAAPADNALRAPKHPVHSVVMALPPLMLVIGLAVFYLGERAQSSGAPIAAESRHQAGRYAGLSVVSSGGEGRHYLWLEEDGERRNVRIRAEDVAPLREALEQGDPVEIDAAPTVPASRTRWLWRLVSQQEVLVDRKDVLH